MNQISSAHISPEVALTIAQSAARQACEVITLARSEGSFEIDIKKDASLATTADRDAEKLIVATIRSHFPEHTILAEESAPEYSDSSTLQGPLWIIDPIDGTTNYAHGHVHVGISIAYAYDGIVQAAVVNAPFLASEYTARRGGGAYCNGQRINVSTEQKLSSSLIATGFPIRRNHFPTLIKRLTNVLSEVHDIRRLGAASIDCCWVACGKLQGYYESVKPWDIAAGGLIAREAGAITDHFSLTEEDKNLPADLRCENLIVAAPGIYAGLREILARDL